MPIYEYLCADCDTRFEKLVRRWGEAVACPACASATVDKQLSVFAVASAPAEAFSGCGAGGCGAGEGACAAPACGLPR